MVIIYAFPLVFNRFWAFYFTFYFAYDILKISKRNIANTHKNLIIQELSEITQEDLKGKQGKQNLQETLKSQINELMQDGEVKQVYITSYAVQ